MEKHTASGTVKCHIQWDGDEEATVGGVLGSGSGEMDEHTTLLGRSLHTSEFPIALPLPWDDLKVIA